jgi:hypothetical protein
VEPLTQDFIRGYLVSENGAREAEEPGFRKPSEADPDGDTGKLYPLFIEPRDGAPAAGERQGDENNKDAILSLFYTGGIPMGTLEKFRRRTTFDVWIRVRSPQTAKRIDDRLRLLLHDKRDWDMDGFQVIESLEWRAMQPIGNGPEGYAYVVSYLFELYADGGL